jgi:hypothetical protein
VLRGLLRLPPASRPTHFSVEAHDTSYLAYLVVAGYDRFRLVNQNLNWTVKLPNPPREGLPVPDHTFVGDSSGPVGEEAPGEWMNFEETAEMYLAPKRAVLRQPTISNAWCDFHATASV